MKPRIDRPGYVLVFAAVVSAVFTAGIMTLHAVTEPIALRAAKLYEQRSIVELFRAELGLGAGELGDARVREAWRESIRAVGERVADPKTGTVYNAPGDRPNAPRVYRAVRVVGGAEQVVGYAVPVWGVGFWARIDGYLAVTPEVDEVIGITFIRHSETPGLGGRISEKRWREEFDGLTLEPASGGGQTVYIGGEPPSGPASPRHGRYVDAITGATGTSRAVEAFLNERIPEIRRALAAWKGGR